MNRRRRKKLQKRLVTAAGWAEVRRVVGLLRAGADPNLESGTREEGLPLCAAACHGHIDTVRELLAAGADPNLREDNGEGWTATQWATAGDHRSTLELLLAANKTPAPPPTKTPR
jgi:ankyrin repeat protein